MATTEADICNLALLRVGQREFIDDLNEATAEAEACNEIYEQSRDSVLAEFPWKFAKRRATLAALSTVTRTGWTYAFALPSDCISPLYIWTGSRAPSAQERIPFEIESDDGTSQTIILSDVEEPEFVYTARVTAPVLFPPLFVEALAWKLAYELALGLAVKPQVGLRMLEGYRAAIANAASQNANQGQPDAEVEAEHIRVR